MHAVPPTSIGVACTAPAGGTPERSISCFVGEDALGLVISKRQLACTTRHATPRGTRTRTRHNGLRRSTGTQIHNQHVCAKKKAFYKKIVSKSFYRNKKIDKNPKPKPRFCQKYFIIYYVFGRFSVGGA
jgi:hypothetical protein